MIIDLNTSASVIQPVTFDLPGLNELNFFVKRDDLIHPFISGNKWRKLKYILRDAQLKNKSTLVTFGGAFSNHLLAVAAAGALFNFKTTGFVRGEELDIKNPVLKMCHLFGMRLIFISRNNYREKDFFYSKYFNDDEDAYFIPEGGSCPEALPGLDDLMNELPEIYDHIFTPVGTGGTIAGLAKAVANRNTETIVNGIAVIKGAQYLEQEIEKWIGKATYKLHTEFHRGGYGKTDSELIVFARNFIRRTGIVIEPVYTAKMLMGIIELAEKRYFKPGSKILFIHTGGIWGGHGLLF